MELNFAERLRVNYSGRVLVQWFYHGPLLVAALKHKRSGSLSLLHSAHIVCQQEKPACSD